MDRDGRLEPLPMPPLPATDLALAPDRQRLALTVRGNAGPDMWIGDLGSGSFRRLPQTSGALRPTWRPDGLEIAFAASKAGPFTLFVRTADDAAPARALTGGPWNQVPSSWSPDGRLLAFTEFHPRTGADIWTVELASTRRQPLVRSAFDDADARFSPDGRWVAYTSNETGRWEVYVRDTRGAGPRVHVSESGGLWPEWSSDGRTLYFSANGRAAAARVRSSQEFSVFPPVTLPLTAAVRPIGAADRDRVLVRRMGPVPARHELRLVIGWFAELARLVREPA
jgi:Tol biopolymer transport system component